MSSRAAVGPAAWRAAARAFSVAASASQAETGLPSSAAAALIVSSTSGGTEIDSFRTVIPPVYRTVGSPSYRRSLWRGTPRSELGLPPGLIALVIIIGGRLGGRMPLVCASDSLRESL